MDVFVHTLEHTLEDTWMMFPFLLITYMILEVFERRNNNSDEKIFFGLQKYGPLVGAIVGLLPQCGFSILAAMLFVQRNITLGSLLAVMIATSDEAIPILLSNPSLYSTLGLLLVLKFVIAVAAGYFIDHVLYRHQKVVYFEDMEEESEEEDIDEEQEGSACPCCYPEYPIYISALLRSLKIFVFIFATSFVLTLLIEWIGEENLSMILLSKSFLQPLLAAFFGFIPNCAATVVLSQLYMSGQLQFGSLLAGLITNAGLGLVVLIRYNENKKMVLRIIAILLVVAVIFGMGFFLLENVI